MSEADERERERQAILQRRAKLVAYVVAAGVATAACSGKTSSECLSLPAPGGTGGTPVTTGGTSYCLSIAEGGMPGDSAAGAHAGGDAAGGEAGATGEGGTTAGSGGLGGTPMICLTPPA